MYWLLTAPKRNIINLIFTASPKRLRSIRIGLTLVLLTTVSFYCNAQGTKRVDDFNPNTGYITHDSINAPYFIIKEIILQGNKRTQDKILLREIGLNPGDTIETKNLQAQLIWIKNRIFNLSLFLWTDVDFSSKDSTIYKTLQIGMRERAFFILMPIVGLADRNFNEWWQDRDHDLNRIDYGLNLKIKNILGLNHTLRIKANWGFNRKFDASYYIPYINKRQKTGLIINSYIYYNPQVAFRTYEHKLEYLEHSGFGRQRFNIGFLFTRRNKFYMQHQLGPYFQYSSVSDTVAKLNPDYYLNGSHYQQSLGLKYNFTIDKRDFTSYPLKGYLVKLEADYQYQHAVKELHVASIRVEHTYFLPLSKQFYFAMSARGKLSAPSKQAYFSQRGLGYNKEWVNGYERYVIDGQAFALVKSTAKLRLFSINPSFDFIPHHKFRTIPLSMYFKIYSDAGYVVDNTYNPYNNFLPNRLLLGWGAGFDIVTYYDLVGRIEYSINQLGQTGIYLHMKAGL